MIGRGQEALDYSQKPLYVFYAIQILLELILDLIIATLAVITILIAVGLKIASSGSAASLGLSLSR